MHPCRGEPDVLEQLLSLTGRDDAFEMGDTGGRHMILAKFAEGLDQNTAQAPGRFHVLRRRPAQMDGGRADLDHPGRAIGQEHDPGRNLLG